MEAVIFIGLQAAGKSSFYRDRFFSSHIRINLDMLKTRNREKIIFQACLSAKQSFVVDNTNPRLEDRERYIQPAKEKDFKIVGYYFQSRLEDCLRRNSQRSSARLHSVQAARSIPEVALFATQKRLVLPSFDEGFDELYYVKIGTNNSFIVEEWQDLNEV
ncbi:MAG: AAA family ATPase [Xenococcaceae cyanobacterium]